MKMLHVTGMMAIASLIFSNSLLADIYVKGSVMGGAGTNETWTSGKKQRMETHSSMGNMQMEQIEITRADKGVKWTVNNALKAYQEVAMPIPYDKEEAKLSAEEEKQLKDYEKKMDQGLDQAQQEQDASGCKTVKIKETKTMAGIPAEGYRSECPQKESLTDVIWVAASGNGKAEKIQKELDTFQKAELDSQYSLYPPQDKERTIKLLTIMGKAMAQGMMGMPNVSNMPVNRMMLGMEGAMANETGQMQKNTVFEVIEAEVRDADDSLFEIPEGFTKVENLAQLESQEMMNKMASGEAKFSDSVQGLQNMAESLGMPKEHLSAEAEGERQEGMNQMNSFGQGVSQYIREQAQAQGDWQNPQTVPAAANRPLPTDAPTEPWQQGLYGSAPAPVQPQPMQGNSYVPPPGMQAPQAIPQRAGVPANSRNVNQTLSQVSQILGQVQGITSNFNSGGIGQMSDYNNYPGAENLGGQGMDEIQENIDDSQVEEIDEQQPDETY